MKALQDRAQNVARGGYGEAYGRMERDRAFDYQDYINQFNSQIANIQAKRANLADLANLGVSGTQALTGARTGVSQDIAGMQSQAGQVQGQIAAAPYLMGAGMVDTIGRTGMEGYGMYQQNQINDAYIDYLNRGGQPMVQPTVTQGNIVPDMTGYRPAPNMSGYTPSPTNPYNRSYGGFR